MIFRKKCLIIKLIQYFFCILFCQQSMAIENQFDHPFYLGIQGGAGSTTWDGLVPSEENQNGALMMTIPVRVKEGGGVYGGFAGYELTPYFALEAGYMHYPDARVSFDETSLFSFIHENEEGFLTHTNAFSLMGKLMLVIPNTKLRVYSNAGAADVHRKDMLLDDWRISPTFGFGINYNFTPHIMGEIGGNYTAGFGESQLDPTETYFPFL